jgi:hypothetical protein
MANHPQPGSGIPGPPSDPWQEAPLFEGVAVPAQPPAQVEHPTYPPVQHYPPSYQSGQPYQSGPGLAGPLEPTGRSRSGSAVMATTAAVVVLAGGALVGGYWLANRGDGTPTGSPSSSASQVSASPTRSLDPELDFLLAKVGECVEARSNDPDKPHLRLTSCDATRYTTYRLVARFDNTTDQSKCAGQNGASTAFHYDDHAGTRVVFCLKKLTP